MKTAKLLYRCLRCGAKWERYDYREPVAECPECHDPFWDTPHKEAEPEVYKPRTGRFI